MYNYFNKTQRSGGSTMSPEPYAAPAVSGYFKPQKASDYESRMQTLKDLGVSEDSALYKAMDWRRGAVLQRDAQQSLARDAAKKGVMQTMSGMGSAAAAL